MFFFLLFETSLYVDITHTAAEVISINSNKKSRENCRQQKQKRKKISTIQIWHQYIGGSGLCYTCCSICSCVQSCTFTKLSVFHIHFVHRYMLVSVKLTVVVAAAVSSFPLRFAVLLCSVKLHTYRHMHYISYHDDVCISTASIRHTVYIDSLYFDTYILHSNNTFAGSFLRTASPYNGQRCAYTHIKCTMYV